MKPYRVEYLDDLLCKVRVSEFDDIDEALAFIKARLVVSPHLYNDFKISTNV